MIANLLQPLGDRPLKNRLTHLRHDHVHSLPRSRRSRFRRSRTSRSRSNRSNHQPPEHPQPEASAGASDLAASAVAAAAARTSLLNHRHHCIDLHRRASATLISVSTPPAGEGISASTLSVEISNSGSSRCTVVARLFQPFGNRPLKNRLAHLGHDYIRRHRNPLPLHRNLMATRITRATSDYKAKKQAAEERSANVQSVKKRSARSHERAFELFLFLEKRRRVNKAVKPEPR